MRGLVLTIFCLSTITNGTSLADDWPGEWRGIRSAGMPSAGGATQVGGLDGRLLLFSLPYVSGPAQAGTYDFATHRWAGLPVESYPSLPRGAATALGREMAFVWGGCTKESGGSCSNSVAGGWVWDARANTWTTVTEQNAPAPRFDATVLWDGRRFLVFGGLHIQDGRPKPVSGGAFFDPFAGSWESVTSDGAPTPRYAPLVAFVGERLIVWGGYKIKGSGPNNRVYLRDGAVYDIPTKVWRVMDEMTAPAGRTHAAVASDRQSLFLCGGSAHSEVGSTQPYHDFGDCYRYEPEDDSWEPLPAVPSMSPREGAGAVWAAGSFVVWGGSSTQATPNGFQTTFYDDGWVYSPSENQWRSVPHLNSPDGGFPMMHWNDRELIVLSFQYTFFGVRVSGGFFTPAAH